MIFNLSEIKDFSIKTGTGSEFPIVDFIFDTNNWFVQYLVADIKLQNLVKRILISTSVIKSVSFEDKRIDVEPNDDLIKKSAESEADLPVSWEREIELAQLFKWPFRRTNISEMEPEAVRKLARRLALENNLNEKDADPALRSFEEIKGYEIHSENEAIGRMQGLIIDSKDFKIRFLHIEIGGYFGEGQRTLIAPVWVDAFNWDKERIDIAIKKDVLTRSPAYDPEKRITPEFELQLFKYFGNRD